MPQLNLFDRFTEPAQQPQSNAPAEDRERLSRQCAAILERLRQGPAENTELNEIAYRYSARIHELRKAGHTIESKAVGDGVFSYRLKLPRRSIASPPDDG